MSAEPARRHSRVVVATAYGGPEVLAVLDVEQPLPGAGQVLIEVQAAGTNPFDHKVYSGTMGRDPALLPMRLGAEVAGVVGALGEGVGTDSTGAPLAVGDAVIGYRVVGGYASQVIAGAQNVFARPENLTAEQAAGLLLTGVTAAHLLTATRVGPGDTVLIHGAAGGVGSMATQLAVVRGARVIGTASTGRHEAIRALGGEPVSYGTGLAERVRDLAPGGLDAALDTVGTDEAVDTSLELVADRSRIATIAAFGRAPGLGIQLLGGGAGADPGTAIRAAARAELVALAGQGRLTVSVDRSFALDDVAAAHTYLATGHVRGKVVLLP